MNNVINRHLVNSEAASQFYLAYALSVFLPDLSDLAFCQRCMSMLFAFCHSSFSARVFDVFGIIAEKKMGGVYTFGIIAFVTDKLFAWVLSMEKRISDSTGAEFMLFDAKSSVAFFSLATCPHPALIRPAELYLALKALNVFLGKRWDTIMVLSHLTSLQVDWFRAVRLLLTTWPLAALYHGGDYL